MRMRFVAGVLLALIFGVGPVVSPNLFMRPAFAAAVSNIVFNDFVVYAAGRWRSV
jgi:hypothetical protein